MARPREFEPEAALDAAMRVFWEKGFSETSYDDLVAATGVSRKGLYTVFGDKRALHLATLQHYRKTVIPTLFAALDNPKLTTHGIGEMFRRFVEISSGTEGRMGCYMAKTSSDAKIADEDVKAVVDHHWLDLQKRFEKGLSTAGVGEDRVADLAHYFVGVMQGLLTLAHARAGRDRIEPFIEEALQALD